MTAWDLLLHHPGCQCACGLGGPTCSQAAVVREDMLAAISHKGNPAKMHRCTLLRCICSLEACFTEPAFAWLRAS